MGLRTKGIACDNKCIEINTSMPTKLRQGPDVDPDEEMEAEPTPDDVTEAAADLGVALEPDDALLPDEDLPSDDDDLL